MSNIDYVANVEQLEQNTVQHCRCCVPFSQSELIESSRGIINEIYSLLQTSDHRFYAMSALICAANLEKLD